MIEIIPAKEMPAPGSFINGMFQAIQKIGNSSVIQSSRSQEMRKHFPIHFMKLEIPYVHYTIKKKANHMNMDVKILHRILVS